MRTVGVGRIRIHAFHFVNTTSPVHICSCPRSLPSSTCLFQTCFIRSIFSSPLLRALVAISPPSVALTLSLAPQHAADFLFQHKLFFNFIFLWLAFEVFWLPIAKLVAISIDRGIWDTKQDERITPEERWRLFVKMLESSQDPEEWIKSFFLMPGKKSAPTGADDPAIEGVDMAKVGRTNIEEVRLVFSLTKTHRLTHSHMI